MKHYPIAMGRDTGSLADLPGQFSALTPTARLTGGAVAGALVGHLLKKHTIIGALIGAIGGYYAPSAIPPK